MDETDWRVLARLAIAELDDMPLAADVREALGVDLRAALALPDGAAKSTIRELLTSSAILREWLETKVDGDQLRSAGVVDEPQLPGFDVDATLGGDEPLDLGVDIGWLPDGGVFLGGGGGDEEPSDADGRGDDVSLPANGEPHAGGGVSGGDSPRNGEPSEDAPERSWLVTVEDYDETVGLTVGAECAVLLSVGTDRAGATVAEKLDEVFEAVAAEHPDVDIFELTVQVASDDFEIAGEPTQNLPLRRNGPSDGGVTWRITPTHRGDCQLSAVVSYRGNFLTQVDLTLSAGVPRPAQLSLRGRAPDSVLSLERKNLGLFIRQTSDAGYDLIVDGDIRGVTRLPISAAELAYVVDDVQKALSKVVSMTDPIGKPVFQTGLDIPEEISEAALRTLSNSGAYLFNQLFLHPGASEDLRNVGTWLRENATRADVELAFEVMAENAPIPWQMLYCGETADGSQLSWNNFLGMRHVLHSIPVPPNVEKRDVKIESKPQLSVGLNVDTTIDQQFGVSWIAEHRNRWTDVAIERGQIALFPRSTKASVVAALDDTAATDKIVYFLCHATSGGKDGNPADAALTLGQGGSIVLRDLQSVVPRTRFAARPLIFINACESADLTPRFYAGFVPYFVSKGARGVIGAECKVPVVLAIEFADRFFERFLDGATLGETVLTVRRQLMEQHRNPLGLVYGVHCDGGTRIDPALVAH